MIPPHLSAVETAAGVRAGKWKAVEVVDATLARIRAEDAKFNAFTLVTEERARKEAAAVDAAVAAGKPVGPLAGAPYAVKNLFDIAGVTTLAGSKINRENPAAAKDATLVQRLQAAGAVLMGALNMDEYAYGFTTENTHYGPCHNPHDLTRVAGGSSGGSGAAVAGGLVPLTLGSDTNGSIRVPASLCGIFGLKPTYGRLSRAGSALFVASLDHVGPLARSVADLAASYDAMQGHDAADPVCAAKPVAMATPELGRGAEGLRIAIAGDYFRKGGLPEAYEAVDTVAAALNVTRTEIVPKAALGRGAAFVITNAEGGTLHLPNLRERAGDFDPNTRDRFLAGTLVPAAWYLRAQRFRRWYHRQVLELFQKVDILLAPATPVPATTIGQERMVLDGQEVLVRPNMGLYTQPISCIGLPVVAVPVHRKGKLPIGVQVIAAPWNEVAALRVAAELERRGTVTAPVPAS